MPTYDVLFTVVRQAHYTAVVTTEPYDTVRLRCVHHLRETWHAKVRCEQRHRRRAISVRFEDVRVFTDGASRCLNVKYLPVNLDGLNVRRTAFRRTASFRVAGRQRSVCAQARPQLCA